MNPKSPSEQRHQDFHSEGSEDYQRFLDSMIRYCHCSPKFGGPCDGVLAGGLCDNLGNGPDEDAFDDDEDIVGESEY